MSDARTLRGEIDRRKLTTQIEVHDRQQLELRLNYLLGGQGGEQRYTVDSYFFVPRNVGVNRTNFTRDQFYGDVTSLMRLDAETLPLERLADRHQQASPLYGLALALTQFRSAPRPPPSRPIVVHVKLYAHLFVLGVKAEAKKLVRQLAKVEDEAQGRRYERKLTLALERIERALVAYRDLRGACWPFEDMSHRSLQDALRNADEYMSLALEGRLTSLAQAMAREHRLAGTGFSARCRLRVVGLASAESAYRRKLGYLTLSAADSGDYFSYRFSLLKKAVHQALYLDPRLVEIDTFRRNAVGAVAAALAGTWALAAAAQLPRSLAAVSGSAQAILFTGAVLAYVAKDRIKTMSNDYLSKRLRRFDHHFDLAGESLAAVGLGMLRARIGETMRFLKPTELPPDVRELRAAQRTMRAAEIATEEVIHHRKSVQLSAEDEESVLPEVYSVRDILRLNVRHFLVRLDEPVDQMAYFDWRRESFATAKLPKVYHLNLVLKTRRDWTAGVWQERLDRIRVVLNKEGIVRVELVESREAASPAPEPTPA